MMKLIRHITSKLLMMKFLRNKLCACGSGLKSKKCCAGKQIQQEKKMTISIKGILDVAKFGLENMAALTQGIKNYRVKDMQISSVNTILCEYYSDHQHSLDIRNEISPIITYLYSLLDEDVYEGIKINYFAVKAFDNNGTELLFAISNKNAACAAAKGNSIEWIKNTYFQENTQDYRLARAKTFISDIENALRNVIVDIYKRKFGSNWWDLKIDAKISKTAKEMYINQFGESISDGDVLINYTYPLDLKKIVSADWGSFKHLFNKKTEFEDTIVELNIIRREEAHNRDISEQYLLDLERIYNILLSEISILYPNIVLSYLIEHWRSKIKSIMLYENHIDLAYTPEEFESSNNEEKRQLMINDCNSQINFVDSIVTKLNSVKPPISKKQKHDELSQLFSDYKAIQNEKLDTLLNLREEKVPEILAAIQIQLKKIDEFSTTFLLAEG